MGQDVYVKPERRVSVIAQPIIRLKDIATVNAGKKVQNEIENLIIFEVENVQSKKSYVVSIIDIIEVIVRRFPEATISNVGEMDTIIHYLPHPIKQRMWLEIIKVGGICLIIFAGVSTAIMAYHIDTSMGHTFMMLNQVFTGEYNKNPLYITIPYALGIPFGTLIFFNHIGTKKISEDPTPIEVEINAYEIQVEDTIVETLYRQKKKGGNT